MDKYESPSAIAAYRSPFWPKMSNVGNHQSVNICSTSTNFPFLLPINNVTDFDASNNREDDLLGAPSMESTRPDRIVRIDVKFAVWSSQWNCVESVRIAIQIWNVEHLLLHKNIVRKYDETCKNSLVWVYFQPFNFQPQFELSLPDDLHPCSILVHFNANALQFEGSTMRSTARWKVRFQLAKEQRSN